MRWPSAALLLLAPAALVLALGLLAPLAVLVRTSLYATDGSFGGAGWSLVHYARLAADGYELSVFAETFAYALLSTLACLLLGLPLGYHLARLPPASRRWRLLMVLSPLTLSLVVVIFGWMVVLGRQGLANQVLLALGLVDAPLRLLFNGPAVLLVLVAQFLPFMVLPVMTACAGIDPVLEEAGAALRTGRLGVLRRIVLPLAWPGILSGSLLVFVLAASAFLTPRLVGGQRIKFVGSLVYEQAMSVRNWPFAAALSIVLMLAILALTLLAGRLRREDARHGA